MQFRSPAGSSFGNEEQTTPKASAPPKDVPRGSSKSTTQASSSTATPRRSLLPAPKTATAPTGKCSKLQTPPAFSQKMLAVRVFYCLLLINFHLTYCRCADLDSMYCRLFQNTVNNTAVISFCELCVEWKAFTVPNYTCQRFSVYIVGSQQAASSKHCIALETKAVN